MKVLLSIACCVGFIFTACTNGRENNEELVEFEFYSYNCIGEYPDSLTVPLEGGQYCSISGNGVLPTKIGSLDVAFLRDSLTRLGEVIILDKQNAQPLLSDDLTLTELNPDSVNACGVKFNELAVDLVTPLLVVWKDYEYNILCGAAHGTYATSFVNFSIKEGKILTENDIFKDGTKTEITDIVRNKLETKNIDLLVPVNEIELPSNFRLTTHSIEFVYPLYEIAPYSQGEVKVEIDRYELVGLFKEGVEELIFGENE